MSNRGVRGVRVVGPGSRPSGGQPSDRSSEPDVDKGFDPAEAAALASLDAAVEQPTSTPAAGPESETREHVETGASGDEPAQKRAPSGRRWPLRVATSVAVLGVAGTIGFGYGYFHLNGQQGAVSAAKKQAQNYIVALTNFDPKGLDNEINKIQSYTTGNFKNSISQFFSNQVRQTLLSRNAASRGQVRAIYPQANSGGRITFFAVVDDTIANNQLSAPQSDEIDMTVDMVKTSQGWRVANNTFLQSPLFSPTQPGGSSTPSTTAPKP
ncbi:MAG TPA: hypothetical protein VG405_04135 [Solirubrobacteraceae bacterium]|jgi:hypothetical protein|nr:hypothetical protein [Solirubrobacteraceae bacterium]